MNRERFKIKKQNEYRSRCLLRNNQLQMVESQAAIVHVQRRAKLALLAHFPPMQWFRFPPK